MDTRPSTLSMPSSLASQYSGVNSHFSINPPQSDLCANLSGTGGRPSPTHIPMKSCTPLVVEVACLAAAGTASGCIVHCYSHIAPSFRPIPGAADQLHMLKCRQGRYSYTMKHENNWTGLDIHTGCTTAVHLGQYISLWRIVNKLLVRQYQVA